jgi:hypothetical protein
MSLNQLNALKEEFYQSQSKNWFFKKTQKRDCAKEISEKMDLSDLLSRTIEVYGNKFIFNYTVFKSYAHPGNYADIIDYIFRVYDVILERFKTFEVHLILDTFSISAAERYKEIIQLFCNKCTSSKYTDALMRMFIYYTPSMMDSISKVLKPFIDPNVVNKIVMYNKYESAEYLTQLYTSEVR